MNHFPEKNKDISQTTDMMVDMLANDEKLVDSEEQIGFNKESYRKTNNNYDTHLDDDLNNYSKKPEPHIFKSTPIISKINRTENEKNIEKTDSATEKHKTDTQTEKDEDDESKWTKEEKILRKLDMLRKLGELTQAGIELSADYDLDSDYKIMKYEYEMHTNIKSKRNALSWMGNMLIGIVKGIELLNDNINPFHLKFDGMWSDNIKGDISNYYDVLGEIYEKYTSPNKKLPPELKLFLLVTGSAVSIQMNKGMANIISSHSHVANDLQKNPDKFSEMKNNIKMREMEQKDKLTKKFEIEHDQANEKIMLLETLKKQKAESDKIKQNNGILNYRDSLLLTDSVKSRGSRKSKLDSTINQMQDIIELQKQQQLQKQTMLQETKQLETIDKMISQIKNQEIQIMNNNKNNKPDIMNDEVSIASSAVSQKNPKFEEILKGKKKSKVLQTKIVSKTDIEDGECDIPLENNKEPVNKKKKRVPKKIILT